MVRLSKNPLKGSVAKKVESRFVKTIVDLRSTKTGEIFLEDLLSEAEFTMLAKRLAALFMLARGVSPYRVHVLLHMSKATTSRLNVELENGFHPHVIELVEKKNSREKIWADLEVLIRLGMPSIGKDRWKWFNETFPKEK